MGERLHHTIKRDRRGHMFTLYINSLTTAKFLYLEFSCANTLLFNYYLMAASFLLMAAISSSF